MVKVKFKGQPTKKLYVRDVSAAHVIILSSEQTGAAETEQSCEGTVAGDEFNV
jgi:hypothetical protein